MKEIKINPKKDLIFDNKVVEQCKNCKRYGKKATCPPYIDNSDYYQKILFIYKNGVIYYKKFIIDNPKNWVRLGKESSIEITNFLLKKRTALINKGHYFAIAFGAGSCKLCEECSFPCRFPDKSLIPLEGTGLDIIKTMKKFGVIIKHPVKEYFYRVGAIFYD